MNFVPEYFCTTLEMELVPDLSEYEIGKFIDYCKDKFGWSDLSKDIIMDAGCGEDGLCGKAILARFPKVSHVIGIEYNINVLRNFRQKNESRMRCEYADLLNRSSLQPYAGRMSKVVSTNVFHSLKEKEEAFSNVYRILKPGGEAAIFFVIKCPIYEWVTEMLKIPKWKSAYKGNFFQDMYNREFGADHYKEMVGNIGFEVVDCKEEKVSIPYPSDEACKEALCTIYGSNFNISPELIGEFKESCLEVLEKVSERDEEGRPCYRSTELSLLLTKPV